MEVDGIEPEREPLRFELDTHNVPPDMEEVMLQIKQLAENLLYHWKTFPLVLPPSITATQQGEGMEPQGVISFKDLFMAPTFDELDDVALDAKGDHKKLNDIQLQSICKRGEFEVQSIHFPGQVHRWRLSQLLQKGVERAQDTLLNDCALALRLMIITARNRFHSHFFSLSQAGVAIKHGLWQLLDMLIGLPSTTPGNLFEKLQEEHGHFLVAELNVQPSCRRDWLALCDFIREKCSNQEGERSRTDDLKPPPAPYRFQTPKGSDIDLRLYNKHLMNKCTEILRQILDSESKGWYVKYKDRLIMELKGQDYSYDEITKHVNESIKEEYLRRVYDAVRNNEELENLQPKIGILLVQQAKASLVMGRAIESVRETLRKHQEEHMALLVKSYPVRSRIPAWMHERLQEFKEDFIAQNQWVAHEESMEICRQQDLDQAVYFIQRDLMYLRDMEPVLKKELSRVRNPTRVFTFQSRIWKPHNWIVERHLWGETDVIPTVIVSSSCSRKRVPYDDSPSFSVEKYTHRKTSTRYPLWRWLNYFLRSWTWTWNAMFWLGLVIPWCSPVGLRALFSPSAFMADLSLNDVNGTLCPKESSKTHTLLSRLHALWDNVRHSRTKFEAEPDTGFLGKSFTRHVNRAWNYVFKGFFGSILLVLGMTPVCLLVSTLSVLAAFTAPLWMPVVTLVAQIGAVIFYDYDHPSTGNAVMYVMEALLYQLLTLGVLQPICAFLAGLIVLPMTAFFVVLGSVLRRGGRAVWDTFMFHGVIKKRGRVPSEDSFVVRRTEGPGLASNYFYQVRPEQGLAAVEARMELHELNAWKETVVRVIEQPKKEFRKFVQMCFQPFSVNLVETGVYRELDKETQQLLQALNKVAEDRQARLWTGLTDEIRRRVKLSARELKVTISQTAKMLEGFYPHRVLSRRTESEAEFWENKHLEPHDWQGLATQMLTEVFSSNFLTPLEDTDTCFKLEVEHLNLSRYLEMLKSAEFRDDLDVVSTVHTPKGDIDVDAPYMEAFFFSPYKERVHYSDTIYYDLNGRRGKKWPWKKKTLRLSEIEKLEVPLPVAHPALISVLIYNRENDQDQLSVQDAVCQRVMTAVRALPYVELRDPNMLGDLCETEASTPDHTTNSETDVPLLNHLAEPERAFSDDNMTSATPESVVESFQESESDVGDIGGVGRRGMPFVSPSTSIECQSSLQRHSNRDTDHSDDDTDQVGAKVEVVVYRESEADTSCVLQIEEDEESDEATTVSPSTSRDAAGSTDLHSVEVDTTLSADNLGEEESDEFIDVDEEEESGDEEADSTTIGMLSGKHGTV